MVNEDIVTFKQLVTKHFHYLWVSIRVSNSPEKISSLQVSCQHCTNQKTMLPSPYVVTSYEKDRLFRLCDIVEHHKVHTQSLKPLKVTQTKISFPTVPKETKKREKVRFMRCKGFFMPPYASDSQNDNSKFQFRVDHNYKMKPQEPASSRGFALVPACEGVTVLGYMCRNCRAVANSHTVKQRLYQYKNRLSIAKRRTMRNKAITQSKGAKMRRNFSRDDRQKYMPIKNYPNMVQPFIQKHKEEIHELKNMYKNILNTLNHAIRKDRLVQWLLDQSSFLKRYHGREPSECEKGLIMALQTNLGKKASGHGNRFTNNALTHLAINLLNYSKAGYSFLSSNLPSCLPAASTTNRYRQTMLSEIGSQRQIGLIKHSITIAKNSFAKMGWTGGVAFQHDSTRVREFVSCTKENILVGFSASKSSGEWVFEFQASTIEDADRLFQTLEKAGYVLLGLYTPLVRGLPCYMAMIIGHTNKYSRDDLLEWFDSLEDMWKEEKFPVVQTGSDMEAKNLHYMFSLLDDRLTAESIGLRIPGFFVFVSKRKHGWEMVPICDTEHGINLGKKHLIKLHRLVPTPVGAVSIQHLYDAIGKQGSTVVREYLEETDTQNSNAARILFQPCNRRAVLENGKTLAHLINGEVIELPVASVATAVFMYIQDMAHNVYNSSSPLFTISDRIIACGCIEGFILGWRTYVKKDENYTLTNNFTSSQAAKFLLVNAQAYVTALLIHLKYFPNLPFDTSIYGSQPVEESFRFLRQRRNNFTVRDVMDDIRVILSSLKIRELGLLNFTGRKDEMDKKGKDTAWQYKFPKDPNKVEELFVRGRRAACKLLQFCGIDAQHLLNASIPSWMTKFKVQFADSQWKFSECETEEDDDEDDEEEEQDNTQGDANENVIREEIIRSMETIAKEDNEKQIEEHFQPVPSYTVETQENVNPAEEEDNGHSECDANCVQWKCFRKELNKCIDLHQIPTKELQEDINSLLNVCPNKEMITICDEVNILRGISYPPWEDVKATRSARKHSKVNEMSRMCALKSKNSKRLTRGAGRLQKYRQPLYGKEQPTVEGNFLPKNIILFEEDKKIQVGIIIHLVKQVGGVNRLVQSANSGDEIYLAVQKFTRLQNRWYKCGNDNIFQYITEKDYLGPAVLTEYKAPDLFKVRFPNTRQGDNDSVSRRPRPHTYIQQIDYDVDLDQHLRNRTLDQLNIATLSYHLGGESGLKSELMAKLYIQHYGQNFHQLMVTGGAGTTNAGPKQMVL